VNNRSATSNTPRDLRRRISRQAWLSNRARNALRRPVFIGAISVATFVTAMVSMVVVPRATRQAPVAIPVAPRPDTVGLIGGAALGRIQLAATDSMLDSVRTELATRDSAANALLATDSVARRLAMRDSVQARIDGLSALLTRAEQAPLPSSYRALATSPELRNDPRVPALVDSLNDVERERESVGAVGGVDPIFVALTSRGNEIGKAIQAIATARRNQLVALRGPDSIPVVQVAEEVPIDTMELKTRMDSIMRAVAFAEQELIRRRAVARDLDLQEERARERANAVAPPLALLAAAFVLSAVMGFGVAFFAELRRPRVTDASELERYLGARVLATVETPMPSVDRGRREADRTAPPYFDPGAEAYQLSYLGLATEHPTLLVTTVTGDDPAIAAVVACNLAAVAADEARNTLVVDLEPSCRASAALRARLEPGITNITSGSASWPDTTVSARVGRDKTVDLVPCGTAPQVEHAALIELLRNDAMRLARYYDAVFLVADPPLLVAGLPPALPATDVIYCVQPGITPLKQLKAQLNAIRDAGGTIRGLILWNAERPLLPTPRELARRASRRESSRAESRVPVGSA
jgi:Mrp family chromosome partitioning ATPase